jgi:hypothetical protein
LVHPNYFSTAGCRWIRLFLLSTNIWCQKLNIVGKPIPHLFIATHIWCAKWNSGKPTPTTMIQDGGEDGQHHMISLLDLVQTSHIHSRSLLYSPRSLLYSSSILLSIWFKPLPSTLALFSTLLPSSSQYG